MNLRFSMPRVKGRGAGLGNELTPWARSFLAAQVVDAHAIKPAFGLNKRQYWRHFGTTRYDWLLNKSLERILPVVEFTEADYIRHGAGDFLEAFSTFAEQKKLYERNNYLLVTEGMWGGFRHIAAAKDFVYSTLYQSKFAAKNLLAISARLNRNKFVVAMHIRLGDFGAATTKISDYRGKFNIALPLEWYCNIAKNLIKQLGDNVQFLIISDGTNAQLKPLLDEIPAVTTNDIPDSDCSDLLALAKADLLVCSVSSYSAWAAFLSDAPYIWFEPNLQRHSEGYYSIWGHEAAQKIDSGFTKKALLSSVKSNKNLMGRGVPVDLKGKLPKYLIENVLIKRDPLRINTDLVQYGIVAFDKTMVD
jgi:hypothetical protein